MVTFQLIETLCRTHVSSMLQVQKDSLVFYLTTSLPPLFLRKPDSCSKVHFIDVQNPCTVYFPCKLGQGYRSVFEFLSALYLQKPCWRIFFLVCYVPVFTILKLGFYIKSCFRTFHEEDILYSCFLDYFLCFNDVVNILTHFLSILSRIFSRTCQFSLLVVCLNIRRIIANFYRYFKLGAER